MTADRPTDGTEKGIERANPSDRVSRTESIGDKEQNVQHRKAVDSNPNRFDSVASLPIPNQDKIEPFQIVDGEKTNAASRALLQGDKLSELVTESPQDDNSFFQGLKALEASEGASQEEKDKLQAEWSIKYIEGKAREVSDHDGTELAMDFKGYVDKIQRWEKSLKLR